MTSQLSEAQVAAVRSQAARAAKAGDEQFVAFFEKRRHLLADEQFEDLAAQAAEAFDRLEEAKAETKRQEALAAATPVSRFAKMARQLEKEGHAEAAAALDGLEEAVTAKDGRVLSWSADVLSVVLQDKTVPQWFKAKLAPARNEAREAANAAAEATAEYLFSRFVRGLENARSILARVSQVPKEAQLRLYEQALRALESADSIRFGGHLLAALERLMKSPEANAITDRLREDRQLAEEVAHAPERRQAVALLDGIKIPVETAFDVFDRALMEQCETATKRPRVSAERRAKDAAYRKDMKGPSSKSPLIGKGKKSPRSAGDPNNRKKR